MSHHLTYAEAVVTGLIQGVTELFPVSSLGHNVLLPALIGGQWAQALNVSAPNSPYLAFIVGLHVATALAMIAYFWRDWLRIVRGFFSSVRRREIATADQRLAWMIILATIPVGIVGAALQKVFTHVFARPELTALFLAANGLILLYAERQRRARTAATAAGAVSARAAAPVGGPVGGPMGGPARGGYGYEGYSQQPRQQQWQGPDPRYGQDDWQYNRDRQYDRYEDGQYNRDGRQQFDRDERYDGHYGQDAGYGRDAGYGQDSRDGREPGYRQEPWGSRGARQARDPRGGQDPRYGQAPWDTEDPRDYRGGRNAAAAQEPRGRRAGRADDREPTAADRAQAGRAEAGRAEAGRTEVDRAVAADRRLSTIGYGRAVLVGSAQILALLPGISRDGIVTVTGMWRGLSREDAVRFSFLLSAPVILAAGVLKAHDLVGPMGKGIHGPVLVGSLLSFIGAYLSVRFLTKYFSEEKSLNPFGIYCLVAGIGSFLYLLVK